MLIIAFAPTLVFLVILCILPCFSYESNKFIIHYKSAYEIEGLIFMVEFVIGRVSFPHK